jgi:hypothetical protein
LARQSSEAPGRACKGGAAARRALLDNVLSFDKVAITLLREDLAEVAVRWSRAALANLTPIWCKFRANIRLY